MTAFDWIVIAAAFAAAIVGLIIGCIVGMILTDAGKGEK